MQNPLTKKDLLQIKERGLTEQQVLAQLEHFKKRFPFVKLHRPCTPGDGITVLSSSEEKKLQQGHNNATLNGRTMKFVPASGVASRMFKSLQGAYNLDHQNGNAQEAITFVQSLEKFAFYDDLRKAISSSNLSFDELASNARDEFKTVLKFLLTDAGLNYASLPKGLLKFHRYEDRSRTAFEEHLVEATAYIMDKNKLIRLHFTLLPQHLEHAKNCIDDVQGNFSKQGIRLKINYSTQKLYTDVIAVDNENEPIRNSKGKLVFRPGGHGALIANLNDLQGDIIFIKNIDNIVHDRLQDESIFYKKVLGGYLVELQTQIFSYLEILEEDDIDDALIHHISDYAQTKLSISMPEELSKASNADKQKYLFQKLNRPVRVCGMVKNKGEPGGGPFWVQHGDNSTLQIVEEHQVDMESQKQNKIWKSATHFNPVDLVCGVRDYQGHPFDLAKYIDENTGFISHKSIDGQQIKAQELPGLWNGAMADWITVFVEVPITTFNPVKTVFDLLREEHQPTKVQISNEVH